MKYLGWIFALAIVTTFVFVGCENKDDDDNATITAMKTVIRINNAGSEIEVEGPLTLVLSGANMFRSRSSCSGFEPASVSDIAIGDTAEYSYVNREESDYADRTIRPHEIRFWRVECIDPESEIQYLLDTDKDGVADVNDSNPTNAAVQ